MSPMRAVTAFGLLGFVLVSCLAGCSGGTQPEQNGASQAKAGETSLPTASIKTAEKEAEPLEPSQVKPPEEGTAQWFVWSILNLKAQPFPQTQDPAALAAARQERNDEIIALATQAIAKSHGDEKLADFFDEAVHHLMEARLQLALGGDREDIDALYSDAASLKNRDPKSNSAAEAAFTLARMAHMFARRNGTHDPRWLQEFAKLARTYAADFPEQHLRSLPLLVAASTSCELHGLTEDAIGCYRVLAETFPTTPQAAQAAASLRRLQLKGQPLELAGPTLEGGFVKMADYKGKVVLISFWASDSPKFVDQAAAWVPIAQKYEKHGLAVINVCLDMEETAIDAFLEQNPLPGVQIFHTDRAERRWNNPIVKYYGVREIPVLWLVDKDGTVVDIQADPLTIEAKIRELLLRGRSDRP